MKIGLWILLSYVFFLAGCDCCKDTEKYKKVGYTLDALFVEPESFCDYVAETMNTISSSEYKECAEEKFDELEGRIQKIENKCDDIIDSVAIEDPGYHKLKCDQEHGKNELIYAQLYVLSFLGLRDGRSSCSAMAAEVQYIESEYEQARIYLNAGLAPGSELIPDWDEAMAEGRGRRIASLTCEEEVDIWDKW